MTAFEGMQYLLDKCAMNEPVFILRGRDSLAHNVVLDWANAAEKHGVSEEKVCSAIAVSHEMMKWSSRRLPD